ncbi:MAG: hypothetical protein A2Y33_05455 [Spirochaetes bacterium GWF1_51_8]|nr:MAG: hypothetical protein A2Y33_05450 [Spirochaetes bacterium GWF1_51_8]OHD55552.1 MAG: hypothetical protein A2Y33_05455 [Spirochaetes bacterium GWF1_51_8]
MKRFLGVLLMVAAVTVFAQAKYYSYKPANLMIDIPSGWNIEEVKGEEEYLEVTSPNSEVIIYLEYYDKGGFGDYSADEEYEFLETRLDKILGQDTLEITDQFEEDINGMMVYAISGEYEDEEYGMAYVYCGAFETGKQLSTLTVDVLESDMKKFKDKVNAIIDSAKKIK